MKFCVVGDPMISSEALEKAVYEVFGSESQVARVDWVPESEEEFWYLRSQVEKLGPQAGRPPEEIAAAARDADVIITHHTPIQRRVLEATTARYVGVCRAGTENADVAAATERGIKVLKTVGRNAEAVADFTMALLLSELRNVARGHAALMRGEWRKKYVNSPFMGDAAGKTVGLVGFGVIGRLLARKLSGFQVDLLVCDPFVSPAEIVAAGGRAVSLDELCRESDFISLHARLSEETRGLLDERAFALMKPTCYLINTARAGLISESALVDALLQKKIGGAAIDVFWTEPLPEGHPMLGLDNVTLTPHLAGATTDTLKKTPYLLLNELRRVIVDKADSRWVIN